MEKREYYIHNKMINIILSLSV